EWGTISIPTYFTIFHLQKLTNQHKYIAIMYIDKENNVGVGSHLAFKYLRNKDGKTTNPTIWMWTKLNLNTNEFDAPTFTVSCFDHKETYGYTNRTFTT